MQGEIPDADRAAREYEDAIRSSVESESIPRFDVIHLGIGTDGHIASLFPGSAALEERQRLCAGNWVAKLNAFRITMTLPVLNAARAVTFIATGPDKAPIIHRVLQNSTEPTLPAQLIRPVDGELWWMLDRAAAGELT
jgi:6-phosphogluconolactonase